MASMPLQCSGSADPGSDDELDGGQGEGVVCGIEEGVTWRAGVSVFEFCVLGAVVLR